MKDKKETRDKKTGQFGKGNVAAVKHGTYMFKMTGKVPSVRGSRLLMKELEEIRLQLQTITPDLNIKKELIIEQIVKAQGFMRLFETYCRKHGMLNPRLYPRKVLDFQPGFRTYLSFMALQSKAILALGLEKEEVDSVLTPLEIATEFDRKKGEKAKK